MHQKSTKNQQKNNQKSIKIDQNLTPGASWRALGGSWRALGGHLGPKRHQDPLQDDCGKIEKPNLDAFWSQNPSKIALGSLLEAHWI